MAKRQPDGSNLQDKARHMADKLDRMRGWLDEVQMIAAPNTHTFYSHELISSEHLSALREILGELQGFDEMVEAPAQPAVDDDDWEDEPE